MLVPEIIAKLSPVCVGSKRVKLQCQLIELLNSPPINHRDLGLNSFVSD